ncbi:Protein of unknown function [Pseudomonas sp. NFACC02]|uniref:DUF3053 domain-containing protein n=1 Tax=Pseudomonas sp. NFACC02 TaxID=1566250 RepID=UPI0008B01CA8|nr:DUF3053 domain-containing protein [Pseudomonas sp. NFACC02]SEP89070.1 Protein of unknown function [Pseudomonas sp. NFACC02]
MNVSFRPHWLLAIALPLVLAACGSSEPDQRAAFKQFLQTRIVDKPGVHVPKLTPDESKSFGEYATHYAVITDFNNGMDASVKPLGSLVQKSTVRSLGDVVSRRDDLRAVQSGLNDMAAQLKAQQAKADSAHVQLKQPEDLKAVYDSAYDRTVSVPANTFLSVVPQINGALDSSLKVADYLDAHKAQIEINGPVVKVKDAKVQAELNALLQDLNAQAQTVQKAQARMQSMMLGH